MKVSTANFEQLYQALENLTSEENDLFYRESDEGFEIEVAQRDNNPRIVQLINDGYERDNLRQTFNSLAAISQRIKTLYLNPAEGSGIFPEHLKTIQGFHSSLKKRFKKGSSQAMPPIDKGVFKAFFQRIEQPLSLDQPERKPRRCIVL